MHIRSHGNRLFRIAFVKSSYRPRSSLTILPGHEGYHKSRYFVGRKMNNHFNVQKRFIALEKISPGSQFSNHIIIDNDKYHTLLANLSQ